MTSEELDILRENGFERVNGKTYLNSNWHAWVDESEIISDEPRSYKFIAIIKLMALMNNLDIIDVNDKDYQVTDQDFHRYEEEY